MKNPLVSLNQSIKIITQRVKIGILDSDTFDINTSYTNWIKNIYTRYIELASEFVDIERTIIEIDGISKNKKQWMEYVLDMINFLDNGYEFWEDEQYWDIVEEIHMIHGKLLRYLWW